jgi:hypothetical protein
VSTLKSINCKVKYSYMCFITVENTAPNANSSSISIFCQLTDELKTDLMERISNKTLTETHVALAPSVSYE